MLRNGFKQVADITRPAIYFEQLHNKLSLRRNALPWMLATCFSTLHAIPTTCNSVFV